VTDSPANLQFVKAKPPFNCIAGWPDLVLHQADRTRSSLWRGAVWLRKRMASHCLTSSLT
jgi:hypothetical protein